MQWDLMILIVDKYATDNEWHTRIPSRRVLPRVWMQVTQGQVLAQAVYFPPFCFARLPYKQLITFH